MYSFTLVARQLLPRDFLIGKKKMPQLCFDSIVQKHKQVHWFNYSITLTRTLLLFYDLCSILNFKLKIENKNHLNAVKRKPTRKGTILKKLFSSIFLSKAAFSCPFTFMATRFCPLVTAQAHHSFFCHINCETIRHSTCHFGFKTLTQHKQMLMASHGVAVLVTRRPTWPALQKRAL